MKQIVKDIIMVLVLILILALIGSILGCSSPNKASKHQNDSVADRLRQRHAPVKAFKPNLK